MLMLRRPSGRFQVGVQDVHWTSASERQQYNAENHVVGRLYYPCQPAARSWTPSWLWKAPPTWIRAYQYAQGYVAWGFHSPTTFKQRAAKQAAEALIYSAGALYRLPVNRDAPVVQPGGRPLPVIIFSHGAASMRNTYSTICTEFASRGFLVVAVEHADGTASCVQLADNSYKLLEGLGSGPVLESKCRYRVQECLTMVKLLDSLNRGSPLSNLGSSAGPDSLRSWVGALDLDQLAVAGHSCGGATAALAAAEHKMFKCGIALDPWWPLLPEDSAALQGWTTTSPLLAIGSQDWNTPTRSGRLFCDGERQQRVFAAATAKPPGGGGAAGALHLVPRSSGHGTFTDLPFLVHSWVRDQLKRWTPGERPAADPQAPQPEAQLQQVCWVMHTFLHRHLGLSPDQPAAHQQHLEAASTAAAGGGAVASHKGTHGAMAAAPGGAEEAGMASGSRGNGVSEGLAGTTSGALAELLTAGDENMIVAEEQLTHNAPQAVADVGLHSPEAEAAAAAAAGGARKGAAVLTPERGSKAGPGVKPGELREYELAVGPGMYSMKEYAG